jgi:hypothetical protein
MKRIAFLVSVLALLLMAGSASALQVTPLDENIVSVSITSRGDSKDAAVNAAKEQAVLSSAGRILLDENLIRADDLLAKYLRNYAADFVKSVEVVSDEFRGGKSVLESRVYVDYARLVNDLTEKRFVYTPAYRPMFAAFLDEKLDGQVIEQEPSRRILENAMLIQGAKFYSGVIEEPKRSLNLLDDPLLLQTAVVAAERRNVELLVTGTSLTTLREERDLYYDKFFFYDCEMEVSLIRVDTGDVLHKTHAKGSASSRDRAEAISTAIDRASTSVAKELIGKYKAFWPEVVQGKSDYEILLTGASDEDVNIIRQYLTKLSPEATVELKKKFDTSAVLAINSTATRDQVVEALRGCAYPVLVIVLERGKNKFEVQVSG